jgi:hypothetical protein
MKAPVIAEHHTEGVHGPFEADEQFEKHSLYEDDNASLLFMTSTSLTFI